MFHRALKKKKKKKKKKKAREITFFFLFFVFLFFFQVLRISNSETVISGGVEHFGLLADRLGRARQPDGIHFQHLCLLLQRFGLSRIFRFAHFLQRRLCVCVSRRREQSRKVEARNLLDACL
jgi:hypothetical protein